MREDRSAKRRKADADVASSVAAPSASSSDGYGGSVMHELRDLMKCMTNEMASMHRKMDSMADKVNQLEARNGRLETTLQEMSDRQKYHEVLLRNQKWEYPVPRPPQEYWDSIQGNPRIVKAVNYFIERIEKETRKMRQGICGKIDPGRLLTISLGMGRTGDEPSSVYLPYDYRLDPYWNEFERALKEFSHCLKCSPKHERSSLYLADISLPDSLRENLLKAIKSTHFDCLGLENNARGTNSYGRPIDFEDILMFALNYADANPALKELSFAEYPIHDGELLENLCFAIKEHPSIDTIAIRECNSEEVPGHTILRSVITCGREKLREINLSQNEIDTGESTFLSEYLASNPILERLFLEDNDLDDRDAAVIATALGTNTNLRCQDDNPISKDGCAPLQKAEFDDTSLNSAADSNHTCLIDYPHQYTGANFGPEDFSREKPAVDPKTLRASKIYDILAQRNRKCSNVEHFIDVPIEVLPVMLHSIEGYSEYWLLEEYWLGKDKSYVEPLSVVYEILRNWEKALSVYESVGKLKKKEIIPKGS